MYITYDTQQYPIFADGDIALYGDRKTSRLQALERSSERPPPGIRHLMALSKAAKSPFRVPPRLVRTSDMSIVPGTEAHKQGYCALSYPWNWSGDIVVRGKENSIRVDRAKHRLIFHPLATPAAAVGESQQQANVIYNSERDSTSSDAIDDPQQQQQQDQRCSVHYVKFEGVIQQICKGFDIHYIWYDQLCVSNSNREEEVQQMHHYYSNAQFTVVLVPEMKISRKIPMAATTATSSTYYPVSHPNIARCIRAIHDSQWSMRTWTYQEAIVSERLLFVGENTHLWSDSMHNLYYSQFAVASSASTRTAAYYVKSLCEQHKPGREASNILRHLHTRHCTKEHDRVFALANLFPNVRNNSSITYKESVVQQMVDAYTTLATYDLTVLCFGRPAKSYPSTMRHYADLPSWIGVAGQHIYSKSSNHSGSNIQKLWPTNKEKSNSSNDVTVHIQKLVRRVVMTLTLANNNRTTPVVVAATTASNTGSPATANYTIHDGIMHMYSESIHVLVQPCNWDDDLFSSTNQTFSYETTLLKKPSSINRGAVGLTNNTSTRLWLDPKDLIGLKETTGIEITHTLLLHSLAATNSSRKDPSRVTSSICFSLTENCSNNDCVVILSGIAFDIQHSKKFKAYPVIKQQQQQQVDGNGTAAPFYKSIGLCFVRTAFEPHFEWSGDTAHKQRFAIV
ncbi:hypothetical protein BDB00DRAFT_322961 [Zychaea mexicana]|uniref:uncharacterized protein n=1 Tax=Zychaea mexicana TaxID=64656 RepID=UPI0022FF350A|nr:uncharacterized protein BDB00DRAFT_322961 [Zychaea mexicana]KAI9498859.1 hypothetical protein BDB00DRAFT_322961 [Zychaea mexicana]